LNTFKNSNLLPKVNTEFYWVHQLWL